MYASRESVGLGNWFTEAFNAPGNILQWMFPGLTPELMTAQQQAVIDTRAVPAPQTTAKMRTWTIDDLWEAIAQRGQVAQYVLTAGMPSSTVGAEPPPPAIKCPWYESPKGGECKFGSTALWIALGGGVALLVFMRRP